MPSAIIHEAIAKKINQDYHYDEDLLSIGTISPDCWRNVPDCKEKLSKDRSHFKEHLTDDDSFNEYEKFYNKYKDEMQNPFYFGYLVHLIVDRYWKIYIEPRFLENDVEENVRKQQKKLMLQRLAIRYQLKKLSTQSEDYPGLFCQIDEIDLRGLFGDNGTIQYANQKIKDDYGEEPQLYQDSKIEEAIEETTHFTQKELKRLL